jgi:hypothetical protein
MITNAELIARIKSANKFISDDDLISDRYIYGLLKQKASIYSSKRDSAMKVRKDIAECRENIGIIDAKKSQQNLASKSNIKKAKFL